MEIYYGEDVPELLKTGKAVSIRKSRYILVEFSPGDDFQYILNAVRKLQMSGHTVIIAHIERYNCLREDISNVEYLREMGAVSPGERGKHYRKLRQKRKEVSAGGIKSASCPAGRDRCTWSGEAVTEDAGGIQRSCQTLR